MNWYHVPITDDDSLWIEIEADSEDDALCRAENIDDHGLLTIHPAIEKPVKRSPYYDEAIRLFPETLPEPPAFVIGRHNRDNTGRCCWRTGESACRPDRRGADVPALEPDTERLRLRLLHSR